MAWRDDLNELKQEVDAALARKIGEPVDEDEDEIRDREELYQLAAFLQIAQLLVDLNEVVLNGVGRVESTSLIEYYEEDELLFTLSDGDDEYDEESDDAEDSLEEAEELRFSLLWEDDAECAVDVELGKSNGRIFLHVNGDEVRQQRSVLETAVLDAFREEMNL